MDDCRTFRKDIMAIIFSSLRFWSCLPLLLCIWAIVASLRLHLLRSCSFLGGISWRHRFCSSGFGLLPSCSLILRASSFSLGIWGALLRICWWTCSEIYPIWQEGVPFCWIWRLAWSTCCCCRTDLFQMIGSWGLFWTWRLIFSSALSWRCVSRDCWCRLRSFSCRSFGNQDSMT